ncbi:HNH endonuclease [Streptosporangium sandarakinum]
MLRRACLDCGTPTHGNICPPCLKVRERKRGTTAQRGLAGDHARMSRHFKAIGATCACPGCSWHEGPCARLGTPDNPITAGHIVARAKGGTSEPGNYRPECRRCNSAKGIR